MNQTLRDLQKTFLKDYSIHKANDSGLVDFYTAIDTKGEIKFLIEMNIDNGYRLYEMKLKCTYGLGLRQ
jgi:hypothetical protein